MPTEDTPEQPAEDAGDDDSNAEEEPPANESEDPAEAEDTPSDEEDAEQTEDEPEGEGSDAEEVTISNLQAAIEANGYTYALSYGEVHVFADAALTEVLYTTEGGWNTWLATAYAESGAVTVYGLDSEDNVIKGYLPDGNLDDELVTDEDVYWMLDDFHTVKAETSVGIMYLFTVAGAWAAAQETPDEPDVTGEPDESETEEEPADESETPAHQAGDFIAVTTSTRVFLAVDDTAMDSTFPDQLQGCFTKNAVVQIQSVQEDTSGNTWYCVRYLYGDDFTNGKLKWTDTGSIYVLAEETADTDATGLTVTDYAYTTRQLQKLNSLQSKASLMFTTTAMNGFTLKSISGSIGSFSAGQSGLYGSSGKDSAYPQIAKSASHGTIYATPHYLEGYTVYCLEHTLSGPGEGSGSSQTAKGPYTLYDLSGYLKSGGGVNGVIFSSKTMHAIGWILAHSYPFMVLNRSDSNNETWSRVAGQFAIREVIKQLEGSQYVRDYWDMDSFYAFSGGAPAVYLEYARWLAENAIAYSKVTGKITAKNQSLSVSGSNYVGTVTLTTDADLIRIPKSAGTISGNSGGSDSSYYYIKSGDTITITTTAVPFTVTMESIASSDTEAQFLIGVPSVSIQKVIVPIKGDPYPLNSGSLTFELKLGAI